VRLTLAAFVVLSTLAAVVARQGASSSPKVSPIAVSLRGVHTTAAGSVWASGTGGTIFRPDGPLQHTCAIPIGGDKLDFRGVWAWDGKRAVVMSSGTGDLSRLYSTNDGCRTWRLLFQNPDAGGFWDALVFADEKRGLLLGDPVGGRFSVFHTDDGGEHWQRDEDAGLAANLGESVFAASNSALALSSTAAWFGTGGAAHARVFRLNPAGKWTAAVTPLASGTESTGIFSVAFRDGRHGVAVGGDYKEPARRDGTAAFSSDAGATWLEASRMPGGYRSAVAWSAPAAAWIAVGPTGVDVSSDDGKNWASLPQTGGNALSLPWVVGAQGRIGQINEKLIRR
jgi:photosystem II stability/assembly factor-like uncharacterized protein